MKYHIPSSYTRLTWWDKHPDRTPNDYGPSEYHSPEGLMSDEEYEQALSEVDISEVIF